METRTILDQTIHTQPLQSPSIAVLLPCHNEEATIKEVVQAFYKALPTCTVYVYDNASTDKTAEKALNAGAVVRFENRKGKGNVIRRMFADIEADIYISADGDLTYDAAASPKMVNMLTNNYLDMVVGTRADNKQDKKTYRPGHRFGNAFFTNAVGFLFGKSFTDILSGYRVFSRRFVKSFPALSHGFDIETELTIHSLELKLPVDEIETEYASRPQGSTSKLNKYRDGIKILFRLLLMLKETRPLFFFGTIAFLLAMISVLLAAPLFHTYLISHAVPRIPTAILSTAIMMLSFISLTSGIILDSVCRGRKERKYLYYLSLPWMKKDIANAKTHVDQ